MNIRRKLLVALGACALSAPLVTFAQGFPSKPLRLIVRAPPGGTDDLIARLIAPAIGKVVGSEAVFNTPEQMLQVAKQEAELIDKIVRTANIKAE